MQSTGILIETGSPGEVVFGVGSLTGSMVEQMMR